MAHRDYQTRPAYRITVFVPESHLSERRQAISEAGAARYGRYADVFWFITGTEQFTPLAGSSLTTGNEGVTASAPSAELVFAIERDEQILEKTLAGIYRVHPWEEPVVFIDDCRASFSRKSDMSE